ncbi:hypothetical protein B4N89_46710 [Embleya scabrispora]|uniref:Tyr recombinase domain-containing protein n=2 Tax=Embleya scabrispora TaxID=159449 RepID=A0A1T3NI83_9ACTN|nr:hypothetical protein B4N89_46710 [Embleya scabrispora]
MALSGSWLEHTLDGRPASHAALARPFVHWFLLHRARRRASSRRHTVSSETRIRHEVRSALALMTWLDEQACRVEDLDQDLIDRRLDERPGRGALIRSFLIWTAARKLTPRLNAPRHVQQEPDDLLPEDERWRLLKRCLTDETLPRDVRAAGGLLLLFGLTTARSRHLTDEDLEERGSDTYLRLGRHPLPLPPQPAVLLHGLAERPMAKTMIPHSRTGPRLPFPGRLSDQPIRRDTLTAKLAHHGIGARPARNAALAGLANEPPAAIIAGFLGMHPNTAVRWSRFVGSDWTDYIKARPEDAGIKE